jgi:hypothetical protein
MGVIVRRSQSIDNPLTCDDAPGAESLRGSSPHTVRRSPASGTHTLGYALNEMNDAEHIPSCQGSDSWTCEDPDERALAARCCTGCPVLSGCSRLAERVKVTFGVWAGVDRSPRTYTFKTVST